MKKTAKNEKSNKKAVKSDKNIVRTIIENFLKWNFICLAAICVCYVIVYLFIMYDPDIYHSYCKVILINIFGERGEAFLFSNSFLLIIPVFLIMFMFNCFVYSIITLSVLGKTYRSIDAFTDDSKEIAEFSKAYSHVEIKLKDIKLEVLESRQAALESENKKNDLVMYLAHDLKTPLTSVIGYLTLLQEVPELSTAQRAKFTDIALNKAYRLEQLISEFFEITRFNIHSITLQKNRINLNMMLEQIVDEFYPMLSEKNLAVDIDIPERIMMFGDSDKIARVFDNLLKNAVNYSYENTLIRIGARIRRNKVIIKFRNKSDEIPEEKLQRLFDKFYRGDTSRGTATGGSGLGLAIAKQIAELHGGTIKAKSSVDYTDFTVILPFISAEDIPDEQLDFYSEE